MIVEPTSTSAPTAIAIHHFCVFNPQFNPFPSPGHPFRPHLGVGESNLDSTHTYLPFFFFIPLQPLRLEYPPFAQPVSIPILTLSSLFTIATPSDIALKLSRPEKFSSSFDPPLNPPGLVLIRKPRANSFSTGHSRYEWLHLDRDPLSTFPSRHDIAALRARDCEPLVEAHASSDVDGFLLCIMCTEEAPYTPLPLLHMVMLYGKWFLFHSPSLTLMLIPSTRRPP